VTRRSLLLLAVVAVESCRSHEACLYSCAPADVTRQQRTNQVMTLALYDGLEAALSSYASRCGGYPRSLPAVGRPADGTKADCSRAGTFAEAVGKEPQAAWLEELFERLLASGREHGYGWRYVPVGVQANGRFADYTLSADPLDRDNTGFYSYRMSSAGCIRSNWRKAAGPVDVVYRAARWRRSTSGCS
jgi:hypothetical protein